jgi:hypothetical protein
MGLMKSLPLYVRIGCCVLVFDLIFGICDRFFNGSQATKAAGIFKQSVVNFLVKPSFNPVDRPKLAPKIAPVMDDFSPQTYITISCKSDDVSECWSAFGRKIGNQTRNRWYRVRER